MFVCLFVCLFVWIYIEIVLMDYITFTFVFKRIHNIGSLAAILDSTVHPRALSVLRFAREFPLKLPLKLLVHPGAQTRHTRQIVYFCQVLNRAILAQDGDTL